METNVEELKRIAREINKGTATADDKVAFAAAAGAMVAREWLPTVRGLLLDPEPEVRKYAFQAVVLDFDIKDGEMLGLCRQRLLEDEDEDVRSMAATCLGSIGWNSRNSQLFGLLEQKLEDEAEEPWVRGSVYNALLSVMGVPPQDGWFGVDLRVRAVFDPTRDIDRDKLNSLKVQLEDTPAAS